MKILHCCLANYFIDNYGYQENVLTHVHKQQGHEVFIVASTETLDKNKGNTYLPASSYITKEGIHITRLPYKNTFCNKITHKLRLYKGLPKILREFQPDIIFMHDGQTAAVFPIVKYIKQHPTTKLYIDSHTDEVNSARSWTSKNILHRIIYRFYVRHTINYTEKYYGTLPARNDFYIKYYGVPKEKTQFLPMGIDDINVPFHKRDFFKKEIRDSLNIKPEDFVIITGGKIDALKNTDILIEAIKRISNPNIKLILFGAIKNDVKDKIEKLIREDDRIRYIGWLPAQETYKYFFASDLACFIGTHSTLWEESVGYGIPGIFKRWKGITHIDRGGNCILVDEVNIDNISSILENILTKKNLYQKMKEKALSDEVMQFFFYSKIASNAIEENSENIKK